MSANANKLDGAEKIYLPKWLPLPNPSPERLPLILLDLRPSDCCLTYRYIGFVTFRFLR